ncbi:MAG: hypothetical protein HYY67_06120 [Thaumarchaeota archaeon]|nr:hypothetical protein [Nitrososphaerota archaeon]
MPKKFRITAKLNNLWAVEQLIAKVDNDKRLKYEIKDDWTVYIYGEGQKGLLEEAKNMVTRSFGYVDAVE